MVIRLNWSSRHDSPSHEIQPPDVQHEIVEQQQDEGREWDDGERHLRREGGRCRGASQERVLFPSVADYIESACNMQEGSSSTHEEP